MLLPVRDEAAPRSAPCLRGRCSPRTACATSRSWCSTTGRPTAPPTSYAASPATTRGSGCSTGAAAAGRAGSASRGPAPSSPTPRPGRDVLVFVDADVVLAPARGRRHGRAAARDRARPGLARTRASSPVTAAERLVQPLLQWSWLTTLPLRLAERSPPAVAGRGQRPAARRRRRRLPPGRRPRRGARPRCSTTSRCCARSSGPAAAARSSTAPTLADLPDVRRLADLRDGYAKSLWSAFGSPAGAAARGRACWRWPTSCRRSPRCAGSRVGAGRLRGGRAGDGWLVGPADRRPGLAGRARAPGVGRRSSARSSADSVRRRPARLAPWKGRPAAVSRVVVIGAGMGGLAVAARLAAQGHEVTVCEQAATVGGKLGRYERDGFVFDTGPSLLTLPAVYRDLFLKTGDALARRRWRTTSARPGRSAATGSPTAPGSTARPSTGRRRRAARRRVRAPAPGRTGAGSSDRAERIWDADRAAVPGAAARRRPGPAAAVGPAAATCARSRPGRSLRGLGERYLSDPRLRTLLDRYATYTGSDPRRAPAALGVVPYVEQTFGALVRARRPAHGSPTRWPAGSPRSARRIRTGDRGGPDRDRRRRGQRGACSPTASRLPADVVVADADAGARLPRPAAASRAPVARGCAGRPRRCPASCCCSASAAARPSWRTTPCCSRPTTTRSSTRSSATPAAPVADPTVYVCAPDDPAMRPDATTRPGSCSSTRPGTASRPGRGSTGTAPGLAETYADRVLGRAGRARPATSRDRVLCRRT